MLNWMNELSHTWPLFTFFWLPLLLIAMSRIHAGNWCWVALYAYWLLATDNYGPFAIVMVCTSILVGTIRTLFS